MLLGEFGRGVYVGGPRLRSAGTARKRDCGIVRGPLRIPDTGQQLCVAAGLRIEDLGAVLPSALAVDGPDDARTIWSGTCAERLRASRS